MTNKEAALAAWQPIATAPRDGTRILGCYGGLHKTYHVIEITYCYAKEWLLDEEEHTWEPGWWMPLPEPPMNPTPGRDWTWTLYIPPSEKGGKWVYIPPLPGAQPTSDQPPTNDNVRWEFRLASCRLECRPRVPPGAWEVVAGEDILRMNPAELRAIADVIEGRAKG